MPKKKICIFGLGYIGLPTACLFATRNYQVIGVDFDKEMIKKLIGENVHLRNQE